MPASDRAAMAFRRKLLEVLICGGRVVNDHQKRPSGKCTAFEPKVKSERLVELMMTEMVDEIAGVDLTMHSDEKVDGQRETRRNVEDFEEFKRVASMLRSDGNEDRRKEAAAEIRRLAKGDVEARDTFSMLGVIPPLIGMFDPELDLDSQIEALYAILNLGIGNDLNKAAIVKAGSVHKMLGLNLAENSLSEAIVANFLSLSALDANKNIIGLSGAIPFLLTTLRENPNCKIDTLRAIFNLSILSDNSSSLLEAGIMPIMLSTIDDSDLTDHALATISNLVSSSSEARKTLSKEPESFPILIDVLSWMDSPSCQEKSAYVLMVMAYKSNRDRALMAEAGIASALLELTLLGTPLAQKRASRILEILRGKKGKEISAPMEIHQGNGKKKVYEDDDGDVSDEKNAVKKLVRQSLQCNMRRIAKRANLPEEILPPEHVNKTLAVSSTSKSLPF